MHKRKFKVALNLAREYYGDNKLKRKGVRHTKHVHFESTAKHKSVGSMLYEPKKNSRKDPGSKWLLVYDKIQQKSDLTTVNMGLLGGHCF